MGKSCLCRRVGYCCRARGCRITRRCEGCGDTLGRFREERPEHSSPGVWASAAIIDRIARNRPRAIDPTLRERKEGRRSPPLKRHKRRTRNTRDFFRRWCNPLLSSNHRPCYLWNAPSPTRHPGGSGTVRPPTNAARSRERRGAVIARGQASERPGTPEGSIAECRENAGKTPENCGPAIQELLAYRRVRVS